MLLWLFLLFAFFAVPAELWGVWLLVGHPLRGVLGMIMLRFLPRTHEIVEDIDLSDIAQTDISVEKLTEKIKFDLSVQFMNKANESKNWQLFYTFGTIIAYIFDILVFCIALYKFQGVPGHEHADLILLFISLSFLFIDVYYFTWVISLKGKLPPEMAAYASDAILGYSKKMTRELKHNLDSGARLRLEDAKNKFRLKKDQQRIKENEARQQAIKEAQQQA